jgi:ribonuclease HI
MKCYVVFIGRNPGVYNSWMECDAQVFGFLGNRHCSYPIRKEGEATYEQFKAIQLTKKSTKQSVNILEPEGNEGMKLRHGMKFNTQDVIVCFLVVVVLVQSYLLYKA